MNYLRLRGETVIGWGSCDVDTFANLPQEEGVVQLPVATLPSNSMVRWKYVGGELVETGPIEERTYAQIRRAEYPLVGDQLDALWKLIGPTAAPGSDAGKLFNQIQLVKQLHPKP